MLILHKFKNVILPLLTVIILVVLWQIIASVFEISSLLFPSPVGILEVSISRIGDLFKESGNTLAASFLGFVLSLICSTLLSTLFHFSESIRLSLFPLAISSRAIPTIAIAPLVVVWFGTGIVSKVVLSSIVSLFPILINQIKGISSLDREEIDFLRTVTNSRWRIFFNVRLPKSLPQLFVGLKIACSFSVIGVIVAEFIGTGSNDGIGYIIKSSSYYMDTPLTFAAIIFASLLGLLFYGAITFIEKKVVFWAKDN